MSKHLLDLILLPAAILFVGLESLYRGIVTIALMIPLPGLWRRFEVWMAGLPPLACVFCLAFPYGAFAGLEAMEVVLLGFGHVRLAGTAWVVSKLMLAIGFRLWGQLRPSATRLVWFAAFVEAIQKVHAAIHSWLDRFGFWRRAKAIVVAVKVAAKHKLHALATAHPNGLAARFLARVRTARRWMDLSA